MALKENIRVEGKRDIQTKVMTTLFALFAEVERDLISERTREGLAKARASCRKLGRPKGSLGVSRLDGKEDDIRHFLGLGVSKTAIAKITGPGGGVVSSEPVECVARTAARTFETPKELLGIVAGEQHAVERFEQLDDVGDRERCRHTFRATSVAGHASPTMTKLYDRTVDAITVDEIDCIVI